jgi:hypothetical protein
VGLRDAGRDRSSWRRGDSAVVAWSAADAQPLEDEREA